MRALPWILFSAWIACASADPGGADPADPGGADPADPGGADPADPGGADPADTARPILASCGGRGSAARSEPEYIAGRVALERSLFDGDMQHCRYALERACLDWESGRADAGRYAFELAFRFCDDKTAAERGLVASALAREDFGEAYAVFERHSSAGPGDSAALADFAPAVYAGLSLTRYAPRGPVSYRLPKGSLDPDKAYRLSALPGMGLLYAGEPRVAASHFFLSVGFAALAGFSAWRALEGPDRSSRWVAGMDFALITTLFFNRYYFGGMREAARVAREKNLHAGRVKVAALAAPLDPFASPMPVRP